ncbi:AAA family ATPase [bacterium]|nr:AAA family ATPase [bacterium]
MRIRRLGLVRYGHFTDKQFEFPEGNQGEPRIHIIYGPNEAGKSTALRALSCLICDFPRTCEDGFFHGQNNLLAAGEFINAQGKNLFFQRRKGTKDIFSDENQQSIPSETVLNFLGNISLSDFQMRYGIDHVELKRGAEQLAQGLTDTALLSSLLGGLDLARLIKELEDTCDSLFKPRGQNQSINQLLKSYEENTREIHQRDSQASTYKNLLKEKTAREQERSDIQNTIREQEIQSNRLQRLHSALPLANERKALQQDLDSLGEVRRLPADFKDRRINAMSQLARSREHLAEFELEKKRLEERLESVKGTSIDPGYEEQVQSLVKRLQSYRDAAEDLPEVKKNTEDYRTTARQATAAIPGTATLDQVRDTNPVPQQRKELTDLVNSLNTLHSRLSSSQGQIRELQSRLEVDQKTLDGMPAVRDLSILKNLLGILEERGDPERDLQEKEDHLADLQQRSRLGLSRLTGWQGSLESLAISPFPRPETIQQFQKEFLELENGKKEIQSEIQKTRNRISVNEKEISALERNLSVPTEQDLETARMKRDLGWSLVRKAWLDKQNISAEEKEFDPERPLPEAYEHQVENADNLADRLRREAGQVARYATLTAAIEEDKRLLQLNEDQLELLSARLSQKENEWQAIWKETAVNPRTPFEMLAWVQEIPALSAIFKEIQNDEQAIVRLKSEISDLKARFRKELSNLQVNDPGGEIQLREIRGQARQAVQNNETLEKQRTEIQGQIARTNEEIRKVQIQQQNEIDNLKKVNGQWAEKAGVFGEHIQVTPENLHVVLGLLDSAHAAMESIQNQQQRIDSMEKALDEFTKETAGLVNRYAPDLAGVQPDLAVERLSERLKKVIDEVKTRQTIVNDLRSNQAKIEKAQHSLQEAETLLQKLIQEAGCGLIEELSVAEERWDRHRDLSSQLGAVDSQLRNLSVDGKVESLLDSLEGIDLDQLAGEITVIKNLIEELGQRKNTVSEQIGQIQNDLNKFDGNANLADIALSNELILSDITKHVRNYQRHRLALDLLQSQIRTFLKEFEAPMLSKASRFFSQLTRNAYQSLQMEIDANQRPFLQVVSSENNHLSLNQLSSGTLDQLYLALRLGNLTLNSGFNKSSDPSPSNQTDHYPLILDDVLINFDDERAKAAFEVFADLSKSIQIIYFTHHRHLVELAKEAVPKGIIFDQKMGID